MVEADASAISTSWIVLIDDEESMLELEGSEIGAVMSAAADVQACIMARGTNKGAEEEGGRGVFLVVVEEEHLVDGHLRHVWESYPVCLHLDRPWIEATKPLL